MRYGYYLAKDRTEHGDPELSRSARFIWLMTGHRCPGRLDGVSVFSRDGRSTDILICYVDFFREPHPPRVLALRGHPESAK